MSEGDIASQELAWPVPTAIFHVATTPELFGQNLETMTMWASSVLAAHLRPAIRVDVEKPLSLWVVPMVEEDRGSAAIVFLLQQLSPARIRVEARCLLKAARGYFIHDILRPIGLEYPEARAELDDWHRALRGSLRMEAGPTSTLHRPPEPSEGAPVGAHSAFDEAELEAALREVGMWTPRRFEIVKAYLASERVTDAMLMVSVSRDTIDKKVSEIRSAIKQKHGAEYAQRLLPYKQRR